MTEGAEARPANRERRGLDPGVLDFIRGLFADYTTAHQREHQIAADAATSALELAANRLTEEIRAARDHYDTILEERDNRYEERFSAQQVAVQAALEAREKAVQAAFIASEKAIEAAFEASKEAIIKSEVGVEKRADAVYVTLDKLQTALAAVMPRSEAENRYAAQGQIINEFRKTHDTDLTDFRDRLKTLEATKQGAVEQRSELQMMVPWIAAFIAFVGVAVAIAVALGGRTP